MLKKQSRGVVLCLLSTVVILIFGFNIAYSGPMEDGKALLEKFQFETAAEAFKKAVQADPANEEAWRMYDYARCEACKTLVSGCESMTQEKLTITGQTLPDGIKIKDMQILTSTSSKYFVIRGKISSSAPMPINTLKISLQFLDENGMISTGAHFYVYGILPKEEKPLFAVIQKVGGIKSIRAVGEIEK